MRPADIRSDGRDGLRRLLARWDILLVVGCGGSLGSVARWALLVAIPHREHGIAWATWLANLTGAFALGTLMVLLLDVWPPSRYVRPFLAVGVLGGYTTFSTYMLDTRTLLAEGELPAAFGYLFGTLLSGLLAVWLGVLVARTAIALQVRRHRRRSGGRSTGSDPGGKLSERSRP